MPLFIRKIIDFNDTIVLIAEWSNDEVQTWAKEHFGSAISEKFNDEEIIGAILQSDRLMTLESMERLGLTTIGKQERFKMLLKSLQGMIFF